MVGSIFHVTDLESLSIQQIDEILGTAHDFKNKRVDCSQWMAGNILCPLFMQDSSRTYINSSTSFARMGGTVLPLNIGNTRFGSAWSEPVRDFCTLINAACDIVILRTATASKLLEFRDWLEIPLVNAGNGIGIGSEHPMQALIDLYVIRQYVKPADVRILMVGGIHIRTTRTQAKLFHRSGFTLDILAPPATDKGWVRRFDSTRAVAVTAEGETVLQSWESDLSNISGQLSNSPSRTDP